MFLHKLSLVRIPAETAVNVEASTSAFSFSRSWGSKWTPSTLSSSPTTPVRWSRLFTFTHFEWLVHREFPFLPLKLPTQHINICS